MLANILLKIGLYTLTILILFLLVECCYYYIKKIYHYNFWKKFGIMHNFQFKWFGRKFWYSRSVAVTLFTFAKGSENKWYVLANKRGKGAPDFKGLWNCSCGYLEFNESGEEGAAREQFEETNVKVDATTIKLVSTTTQPTTNRQNIVFCYATVLPNTIDNYFISDVNAEKDEVAEIKWIPLDQLNNFKWAFGHDKYIVEAADAVLTNYFA